MKVTFERLELYLVFKVKSVVLKQMELYRYFIMVYMMLQYLNV